MRGYVGRAARVLVRPFLFVATALGLPILVFAGLTAYSKTQEGLVTEEMLIAAFLASLSASVAILVGLAIMRKLEMFRSKGSTPQQVGDLIPSVIAALIIADFLVATASPNFLLASTPTKILETKRDSRPLEKALDAYRRDHGSYPGALGELTTPVAYLQRWPADRCAAVDPETRRRTSLVYAPLNRRSPANRVVYDAFALISVGPDRVPDIVPERDLPPDVPLTREEAERRLAALTYDPSNGSMSTGDVVLQIGGFGKK